MSTAARRWLGTAYALAWRGLPGAVVSRLNFWLPARLAGRLVRIPVLGPVVMPDTDWVLGWKARVIARLGGDGVFLDVGVNLGQTLMELRAAHPRQPYVGCEPNVTCVAYVRQLIRLNDYEPAVLLPAGLSDQAGVVAFHQRRGVGTDVCGTLLGDLRPDVAVDVQLVPVVPLDEARATVVPERVGFVKIDVEGAELLVLRGMRQLVAADRPVILCEVLFTHPGAPLAPTAERNAALMALVQELDYMVFQLLKSDRSPEITGLRPVTAFENLHFDAERNRELCDYLFLPRERAAEVERVLLAG